MRLALTSGFSKTARGQVTGWHGIGGTDDGGPRLILCEGPAAKSAVPRLREDGGAHVFPPTSGLVDGGAGGAAEGGGGGSSSSNHDDIILKRLQSGLGIVQRTGR